MSVPANNLNAEWIQMLAKHLPEYECAMRATVEHAERMNANDVLGTMPDDTIRQILSQTEPALPAMLHRAIRTMTRYRAMLRTFRAAAVRRQAQLNHESR